MKIIIVELSLDLSELISISEFSTLVSALDYIAITGLRALDLNKEDTISKYEDTKEVETIPDMLGLFDNFQFSDCGLSVLIVKEI